MRVLEIILVILLTGVMAMKLTHTEGADFLSMIILVILSFLYFFLPVILNGRRLREFFRDKDYKKTPGWQLAIIIFTGFSLSALLIGFLSKRLHWQGGKEE